MTLLTKHADYYLEKKRLGETIQFMSMYLEDIKKQQAMYRSEVKEAYVNLDYLDSSLSYITILVNARHLDNSRESIEKVEKARTKPYFARIDFIEDSNPEPISYYIGKLSLFTNECEPLIIDWRAPVASIYYEGRLGNVSYEALKGPITGTLTLKRNYTIEEGNLLDFFDMDITTNDEVLQASLRDSADERLKDIVATIQAEQNNIIRANLDQPLIVQGVAGSGKTTIALHRIAYLIYTYEKSFKPEQFMIITPNSLFLNYISEVLPELGVDQVEQTTFAKFCLELLKIKTKILGPEEKLQVLLQANNTGLRQESELIKWAAAFKGSLSFKELLDNYVAYIENTMLPQEDVLLEDHLIVTREDVDKWFVSELSYLPLFKRHKQLKKKISAKLKDKTPGIIETIKEQYEIKLERARAAWQYPEKTNDLVVTLLEERDHKIGLIEKVARNLAGSYTKRFKKGDALTAYRKLITDAQMLTSFSPLELRKDGVDSLCRAAHKYLKANCLEPEDLAPLLYLQLQLEGFDRKVELSYAVIDEAQDFSLFQFYVLKQILNTERFTILGDLSQGIYSYQGINDWHDVNRYIFNEQAAFLTLEQSYRTTVEIMDLANKALQKVMKDKMVAAKPVVRHGKQPEVVSFSGADELAAAVVERVFRLEQDGCSSIAMIGKTWSECESIKELIDQNGLTGLALMTGNEEVYSAGVVILPSYAAKGLEFDAVIIISIEEPYLHNELDAKLLYVAMTRSLHQLVVYSITSNISLV